MDKVPPVRSAERIAHHRHFSITLEENISEEIINPNAQITSPTTVVVPVGKREQEVQTRETILKMDCVNHNHVGPPVGIPSVGQPSVGQPPVGQPPVGQPPPIQQVQNPGKLTDNPGQPIQKPGSQGSNPGQPVQNPSNKVGNPGHKVGCPGYPVHNPGTQVGNPGHSMQNPSSQVTNPGTSVQKPVPPVQKKTRFVMPDHKHKETASGSRDVPY